MKKIIQKICTVSLLLIVCATAGCSKGSSTRQENAAADTKGSVAGIIKEVTDKEYMICMNYSRCYLVADKCGTDYKEGDSVKISYTGKLRHYDEDMNRLEDDQFPLTGDKMYIIADNYTGISAWENDYCFYGTLEYIADVRDENGWFGESVDTYFSFVPLDGEDEGAANQMFGQVDNIFNGYASQINDGKGFSKDMSMHDTVAKITYDPETMTVTKVEFDDGKPSETK